jgi:2-oxoglutarate dehydrogenase E1 component
MTPKSLLRHPEAKSSKKEFLSGTFKEIIDDASADNKKKIKRLIFTSGKVYYELNKFRKDNKRDDTAIIRIEQFYPFKTEMIRDIIHSYSNADKVFWVQEEPKNMGAWNFLWHRLQEISLPGQKIYYSGRPESASPAVGSAKVSNRQQEELIRNAYSI